LQSEHSLTFMKCQKNITDRQIEIIEASGKILMEKGILGLTTKNLAQKMNFSESALYRHFKDKEAIISLLITYLSDNITLRFENIVNHGINPEEKFIELFRSQFCFLKQILIFLLLFYPMDLWIIRKK
jgi:TetR/AcrR family fatty acid metabolism transcriptional regulator